MKFCKDYTIKDEALDCAAISANCKVECVLYLRWMLLMCVSTVRIEMRR